MTSGFKEVAVRTGQLAVAVFTAVFLDVGAAEYFPDAPDWLRLMVVSVISAILVEVATLAIVGLPRIEMIWVSEDDPRPAGDIRITFTDDVRTSLKFNVSATLSGGSWLTNLAVNQLAGSNAFISIRMPASPAIAVVDNSPRHPVHDGPLVVSNDAGCVDLALFSTTRPRNLWNWTDLRFEARGGGQADLLIDVVYELRGSGRSTKFSAKLVKTHSLVTQIRFRSV